VTESDTERKEKEMAKAGKFNLTDLLNSRSKELEEVGAGKQEESAAGQQDNAPQQAEENAVMNIDVHDLVPSKDNFYHVDDELKRSIELVGILQPLLVSRPENGKYKVIAGHRRRLAAISLLEEGKEEMRLVPCIFKKADVRDRLALIMANRFRAKTDWEKMMEAIQAEELAKELKKEYSLNGRTREVLAEITGTTEAQLGRYKSIYNNLSARLMKYFKESVINVSVAVELCGMSAAGQEEAADRVEEVGALSLTEAREMKQREEATEGQQEDFMNQPEEYEDPQPENITSLCYSCENYETCHEKKSTVTSCNAYVNREEARKTDEQRYDEQQAEIDRETARKLKERQQEEKMQQLPSEAEKKVHEITLAGSKYNEIASETLTFYLLKNEGYRVGDTVVMQEYTAGRTTGREIVTEITYVWEDWTGLEDDYCIIGFSVQELRRREDKADGDN
jgi:ParB-like chromosome segregation protein Spo0J